MKTRDVVAAMVSMLGILVAGFAIGYSVGENNVLDRTPGLPLLKERKVERDFFDIPVVRKQDFVPIGYLKVIVTRGASYTPCDPHVELYFLRVDVGILYADTEIAIRKLVETYNGMPPDEMPDIRPFLPPPKKRLMLVTHSLLKKQQDATGH